MNISQRTLRQTGTRNHKQNSNKFVAKLKVIILIILPLAAAFAIVNYRIALNEKINLLERESIKEAEKLKNLELEIGNLEIKRARLCSWPYIKYKLAEFRLDLRPPYHGQVVALMIMGETPVNDTKIASRETPTPTIALR
ncbi:MAG: hypothetical protein L3J71_18475 [Victivallaceae bacterium]|nr:hypothetical protein [Victivallaceae bacterium]